MEQNTTSNNILLSYSPGAYGKFIRLILHEGLNNEYVKVKDYPEEIVYPSHEELGYRAFSNESVDKQLPEEWFKDHNWLSNSYFKTLNYSLEHNFCILHSNEMDQLACTYRLMQTRYQDMTYEYHCKKFDRLNITPSKDIFYFYKRNPLWLFYAWYYYVADHIHVNNYSDEFNSVNYVIDNYKNIFNFYKKYGCEHTTAYYDQTKVLNGHYKPILLDDIRTTERFEEKFKIKMHPNYKIQWGYIQKYGQIIEKTFLDYHG